MGYELGSEHRAKRAVIAVTVGSLVVPFHERWRTHCGKSSHLERDNVIQSEMDGLERPHSLPGRFQHFHHSSCFRRHLIRDRSGCCAAALLTGWKVGEWSPAAWPGRGHCRPAQRKAAILEVGAEALPGVAATREPDVETEVSSRAASELGGRRRGIGASRQQRNQHRER